MTLVNIVLKNVAGEYGPDDCVVFHAPQHREGIGGQTINTAPKTVALVEGVGSVELDPGPVTVTLRTKGWEDTAPKTVNVPEAGPVTLTGLLLDAFEWSPVIVSQVRTLAGRAESAADRAENIASEFGSLEGVAVEVQAAKDAATSAAGSATTAEGHATAAGASATAADASKVSAAGSASAAAQSAVNAANSEWVAGEHKGVAEAAAVEAAASRDAAGLSSMSAADHAVAADGARVGAEAARDESVTAAATAVADVRAEFDVSVSSAAASAESAQLSAGEALAQADRSSSEADRAEAAAQSAESGVQVDSVGRVHLTPELRGELDEKVTAEHEHSIADVSGLQSELDARSPLGHTHLVSEVDGLDAALETAGGPPVIVSTTPPEDTDAIWVNPDEVPPTPPTGGGTAEQDTGWRSIAGTVKLWPTDTWDATKDTLWARRVGNTVHLMHKRSTDITANSWGTGDLIPVGFRPAVDTGLIVHGRDNNTGGYLLRSSGQTVWTGPLISSAYFMAPMQSWLTTDPWPTTLPGTAVEGV